MAGAWQRLEGVSKYDDLGWSHLLQSEVHSVAGRYREALASLLESTKIDYFAPANLPIAVAYALLLRDHNLLDVLLARIAETPPKTGRFLNAVVLRSRACVAAMRSNFDEATALFRRSADEFRDMGQPLDLTFTNLLIISALGTRTSLGEAAARESRQILEPLGARAALQRLEDAERAGPLRAADGLAREAAGAAVESRHVVGEPL